MEKLLKHHPLVLGVVATGALYVVGGLLKWLAPLALIGGAGWWLWKTTLAQREARGPLWKAYEQAAAFIGKEIPPPPEKKSPPG